jgi:hypothetical protein
MRRALVSSVLAIVVAFSAVRLSADSKPFLAGFAAGIELCPQVFCGFALFVGEFEGQINSRPASGGFAAAVEHEDLPAIGQTTPITGGDWTIIANRRAFSGDITQGTILNLDGTRYCVSMEMEITSGGKGELYFTGILDHGPFPPTVGGFVSQSPGPPACRL